MWSCTQNPRSSIQLVVVFYSLANVNGLLRGFLRDLLEWDRVGSVTCIIPVIFVVIGIAERSVRLSPVARHRPVREACRVRALVSGSLSRVWREGACLVLDSVDTFGLALCALRGTGR